MSPPVERKREVIIKEVEETEVEEEEIECKPDQYF
jgi:hypothetical protein